ncbi:LacI family DNA-binding transcriptional regulator [Muricomes intestini]|jgi:LacI family transcriptional regulator|uniref:LacI family DNA-binding transcriptional regulator n=2 Tax=Muricomes intestini TaxID=1796634 RepID=UPI002FDEC30F
METIKDIARICGVGVSTVSRAINNHPDINPETKEMIMQVIKEHNYIPNNSARNLKRSESKAIAVLVKGITNPFFNDMIGIIEQETQRKKYSFILQRVEENENELDVAIQLVKEKKLKGIIFLGGIITHSSENFAQLDVPFVLSTSDIVNEEDNKAPLWSSVSVDDFAESYKMTDYLCKAGHRKIAIIAATKGDESIGKLRLEGYLKALGDNNIRPDKSIILHMEENKDSYSMETGYRLMKKLLKERDKFTAVYAIADSLAVGACRAITETGAVIPRDCSVAGFDGLEIGTYYNPSLTTIRQPVEEMAKVTIDLLFNIIRKNGQHKKVVLPGELLVRESTQEI